MEASLDILDINDPIVLPESAPIDNNSKSWYESERPRGVSTGAFSTHPEKKRVIRIIRKTTPSKITDGRFIIYAIVRIRQ